MIKILAQSPSIEAKLRDELKEKSPFPFREKQNVLFEFETLQLNLTFWNMKLKTLRAPFQGDFGPETSREKLNPRNITGASLIKFRKIHCSLSKANFLINKMIVLREKERKQN